MLNLSARHYSHYLTLTQALLQASILPSLPHTLDHLKYSPIDKASEKHHRVYVVANVFLRYGLFPLVGQ